MTFPLITEEPFLQTRLRKTDTLRKMLGRIFLQKHSVPTSPGKGNASFSYERNVKYTGCPSFFSTKRYKYVLRVKISRTNTRRCRHR